MRRSYEPLALEGQPRITDLIPQKRWLIALLMLVWLSLIAGVVYLHTQLDRWSEFVSRAALAPIDLSGVAGVATWFSSATLLLAAIGSWQVYNVRRHKTDDYRGTYRLWFWTAAWLVFASLEMTAGLRVTVQKICVHYSGSQLASNGDLWWILVFGVPSLVLAARLTFEMRKCKTAVVITVAAGIAYLYAAIFQVGYVPLAAELVVLHRWTSAMAAHFLVLATVAVYARHVLLDAQGHLGSVGRVKKQSRRRPRNTASNSETAAESQENQESKQAPKASARTNKKTAAQNKGKKDPVANATEAPPQQRTRSSKGNAESPSQKSASTSTIADKAGKKTGKQDNSTSGEQVSRKKSRKQKRREQAAKSRERGEQQSREVAPKTAQPSPQKANKKEPASNHSKPKLAEPTPDFTEIEDGQQTPQRLSKAQRRRLRKQRRNEARRAA